ncbi:MAG: hypothetical protein A2821_04130 [Candidatus Magasanikbacteria bacterium RIFCSPHIGHO2_01_FULL_41_23]|nr:MAG: hypothetical protein A2821_04130 [Candidatus Magasanikbacteria bacterium RIFCSPHIGHO2_01_FULL_41_23]OGH67236.1 MAG: hypothetical protein A3C66_00640 [Candidatus Magasanikbacteria bacterium RIFCSPHIGHO2_02_FULL_41_35]
MNKITPGYSLRAAVFFVFLGLFFSLATVTFAEDEAVSNDTFGLQPIQNTILLGNDDIRVIAAKIIVVVLGLLGIIVFGLILYAGFLIMTAAGNEEKITQGKKVMTNAVIGFVIIISAFSIVQFVLKSLTDAFGDGNGSVEEETNTEPFFASFSGTGGLGSVVKDHYPKPNQTNVPRNTKIAVTFGEAIKPSSLIKNSNNTCWPKDGSGKSVPITDTVCEVFADGVDKGKPVPYYGDCVDLNKDNAIAWETECDRVATSSVQLFFLAEATSTKKNLFEMTASASYDKDRKAYIFTFRPLEPIGSDVNDIWHTVKLVGGTNKNIGIKKLDGSDIFPTSFISKFYSWNFQTNTKIDLSPPFVISTRPTSGATIMRNNIIQINFNEPVDPSVSQGILSASSSFTNIIFNKKTVFGEWKISNGYTTLEFIPGEQCGQNSCGEPMYCLPAINCDELPEDTACEARYTTLIRTAALANPTENSFQAQPFTGLMDMASNALDNGPDKKSDGILFEPKNKEWKHKPPMPADWKTIGDDEDYPENDEKNPDNYLWSFKVSNDIDRTIPYITKVNPALEGEGVKGKDSVEIYFSKYMLYSSIPDGAGILEYPDHVKGGQDKVALEDFAYYFHSLNRDDASSTMTTILHPREFGPGGLDLYYFTFVSSSVKADNQNCLYPGRGPNGEKNSLPVCVYSENSDGTIKEQKNCVPVTFSAESDTGCVFGLTEADKIQPDVATCVKKLKAASPSTLLGINP